MALAPLLPEVDAYRPAPRPVEAPTVLSPTRAIGAVSIAVTDLAGALDFLNERMVEGVFTPVAFANAHCVNVAAGDSDYRRRLEAFTIFADGIGVDIASKMLYGEPFPDNLNGTDFVPYLLASLPGPRRIALVGAGPGVAERAAANLLRVMPQHDIRVISDGAFKPGLQTEIVRARLRSFAPDVTLVALGVPKQELFIAQHLTGAETTLAIGVGALLDFLSGRIVRAPKALRVMRLEWAFRLCLEPVRMWRRYVVGNPRFLLRALLQRRRMRRAAAASRT